jgi:hypothetical protein
MPRASPHPVHRAVLLGVVAASLFGTVAVTAPATADAQPAPPTSTPGVVSVGDPYISGEGIRLVGNQTDSTSRVDPFGAHASHDDAAGTGGTVPYCSRSTSALIHIADGMSSLNVACSGATTTTATSDGHFMPGMAFVDLDAGQVGQVSKLRNFDPGQDV